LSLGRLVSFDNDLRLTLGSISRQADVHATTFDNFATNMQEQIESVSSGIGGSLETTFLALSAGGDHNGSAVVIQTSESSSTENNSMLFLVVEAIVLFGNQERSSNEALDFVLVGNEEVFMQLDDQFTVGSIERLSFKREFNFDDTELIDLESSLVLSKSTSTDGNFFRSRRSGHQNQLISLLVLGDNTSGNIGILIAVGVHLEPIRFSGGAGVGTLDGENDDTIFLGVISIKVRDGDSVGSLNTRNFITGINTSVIAGVSGGG